MGKYKIEIEVPTSLHSVYRELCEKRFNHRNTVVLFQDIANKAILGELNKNTLVGDYTCKDLEDLISEFKTIIQDLEQRIKTLKK